MSVVGPMGTIARYFHTRWWWWWCDDDTDSKEIVNVQILQFVNALNADIWTDQRTQSRDGRCLFDRPQKVVWLGSDSHGRRQQHSYCAGWTSRSDELTGTASALLPKYRLLAADEHYGCNNAFILLCVETSYRPLRHWKPRRVSNSPHSILIGQLDTSAPVTSTQLHRGQRTTTICNEQWTFSSAKTDRKAARFCRPKRLFLCVLIVDVVVCRTSTCDSRNARRQVGRRSWVPAPRKLPETVPVLLIVWSAVFCGEQVEACPCSIFVLSDRVVVDSDGVMGPQLSGRSPQAIQSPHGPANFHFKHSLVLTACLHNDSVQQVCLDPSPWGRGFTQISLISNGYNKTIIDQALPPHFRTHAIWWIYVKMCFESPDVLQLFYIVFASCHCRSTTSPAYRLMHRDRVHPDSRVHPDLHSHLQPWCISIRTFGRRCETLIQSRE